MTEWKTLNKETILETGKFLKVENHKIELHDGSVIENWPWIILPDFVNVIAVTNDEKIVCFRQSKYALSGTSIAPIGGYIEPGETAFEAAKRELLEETGFTANDWIELGSYVLDANRGCNIAHFYLAKDARKIAEPIKDDLEEQQIQFLSIDEIHSVVKNGEVKVLSWAFVFLKALSVLSKN